MKQQANVLKINTENNSIEEAFDYGVLPVNDAMELKASAERIKVRLKRTAEDVIEIGKELIAAKERCGHGYFERWLSTEFDMSQMSATRFVNVANTFGDCKSNTVLDLSANALYMLAAPSTTEEVRQQVIERVENGESVSVKEIKRLKKQNGQLEQNLEAVQQDNDALKQSAIELEQLKKENAVLQQLLNDAVTQLLNEPDEVEGEQDDAIEGDFKELAPSNIAHFVPPPPVNTLQITPDAIPTQIPKDAQQQDRINTENEVAQKFERVEPKKMVTFNNKAIPIKGEDLAFLNELAQLFTQVTGRVKTYGGIELDNKDAVGSLLNQLKFSFDILKDFDSNVQKKFMEEQDRLAQLARVQALQNAA